MTGVKPLTAQQAVVGEIRRSILGGEIAPGAPIFVDALAQRFAVSRVPIRDALRVLEGEGLVHSEPHHGYSVAELSISELIELQAIRGILEREAMELAVTSIDPSTTTAMEAAFAEMVAFDQRQDYASWVQAHRRFHFALFDLSGNNTLTHLLHQLWNASDLYRTLYMSSPRSHEKSTRQHRELVDAVAASDIDRMAAIMQAHRDTTVEALSGLILEDD